MLIPVILSGGAGTRLWPVSREAFPKPFMRIAGSKSLLAQTYERAISACGHAAPLIVTNRDYYFLSRDELASQSIKPHYLLEPQGRNTAPAIAMACLWAESFGDPCLLVMPADHLIRDQAAFNAAVREALVLAQGGALGLFGVPPHAPETGFGYIELGAAINSHARAVRRFVEKPDAAMAQAYLEQGNFAWNSGIFCFRASVMREALARHAPRLMEQACTVWHASETHGDRTDLLADFIDAENISIDYAVMEKADNIAVVHADFGWSDIGSWSAVAEASPADGNGNSGVGRSIFIGTRNTHIEAGERLVAAVGLDNLVIVDTPDALLIVDRDKSQDVRKIVAQLRDSGDDAYKLHRTVARPWGTYTVLEAGTGFKIKRIVVKPGQSLSLQMHHHRSEHWVVVSGEADVTLNDVATKVYPNQSTYIPIGATHRLGNCGESDLTMIEVQCGSYLGEDDIVRFSDDYGRK